MVQQQCRHAQERRVHAQRMGLMYGGQRTGHQNSSLCSCQWWCKYASSMCVYVQCRPQCRAECACVCMCVISTRSRPCRPNTSRPTQRQVSSTPAPRPKRGMPAPLHQQQQHGVCVSHDASAHHPAPKHQCKHTSNIKSRHTRAAAALRVNPTSGCVRCIPMLQEPYFSCCRSLSSVAAGHPTSPTPNRPAQNVPADRLSNTQRPSRC